MLCPCHSKKPYSACCEPFHSGKGLPKTALELMRSRYSAYALQLCKYIIDTTYPSKIKLQPKDILSFCKQTQFLGLEILEHTEGVDQATVTFRAVLAQGFTDASFEEKSRFIKQGDRWYYVEPMASR